MNQHTPGPWRWEINLQYKSIQLCGGKPLFDKTVMGVKRWGMNGATPTFQDVNGYHLIEAKDVAEVVPGREHHKEWFQTLNQADANLIAAAPDLLEALQEMLLVDELNEVAKFQAQRKAYDAINKATNQSK